MMNNFNLLIKFPTRQRPDKFFRVLDLYYKYLYDISSTYFVITCDEDDLTMNNDHVRERLMKYDNLKSYFGSSRTKIEAVNADVPENGWDIMLLASDDMIPKKNYYDQIIRNEMLAEYPDTDGVLWFFDGHRKDLNTLPILGKKYYERFGYIYHPDYLTWYADEEFMYVSRRLGKETAYEDCIIEHQHPVWMQKKGDALYRKENDSRLTNRDKHTYRLRDSKNFDL